MKNSKVESHQIIDLSILKEVNEFIDDTNWYVTCINNPKIASFNKFFKLLSVEHQQAIIDNDFKSWPLVAKIKPNGIWEGLDLELDEYGNIPVEQIVKTASIVRQAYGWNDESTARRAPVIYKLFQYINSEYLDNRFTLDGVPEEIGGCRQLFYDENEKGMPYWGQDAGPSGSRYDEREPTEVWTAYANAKTPVAWNLFSSARKFAQLPNRTISNSAHRDWHGMYGDDESDIDGCYTMIVPVNETWKFGEGLELILYETVPPGPNVSVHDRRGYGVGEPTHIFPHKPGLVVLYPSNTIHTTTAPGTMQNNPVLGKNVVFRIRRKPV